MLLTLLSALAAAVSGPAPSGSPDGPAPGATARAAVYEAAPRAVSNWRGEASRALHPAPLAWLAGAAAPEPAFVSRCVRFNNDWCIKRAADPAATGRLACEAPCGAAPGTPPSLR